VAAGISSQVSQTDLKDAHNRDVDLPAVAPGRSQVEIDAASTPEEQAPLAVVTDSKVQANASTRPKGMLDTPVTVSDPAQPSQAPQVRMYSQKREFRERAVPASPLARIVGFGSMAATMALGAAAEAVQRRLGVGLAASSPSLGPLVTHPEGGKSQHALAISEMQAERLAEGLCRMRGAALKIGQMLSLSDDSLLPPSVAAVLERVRTQADIMPKRQLEKVMNEELGPDWRAMLGGDAFGDKPIAAASIGQVHRSVLPSGESVAVKVQYPGVADSINSDLNNLKGLLTFSNLLPKGLYLDSIIQVAREELTAECDYVREAKAQERFRSLVGDDLDFEVPAVVHEVSTRRVLTTTWLEGMPIDQVVELGYSQDVRNRIARKLLRLTLKELFEWRYMQTDPNWGNFFYNPVKDTIGLLDFGATVEYPKPFVDDYLRLVWAAANRDRTAIANISVKLGFLTGYESKAMLDAHVDSGMAVGEPFVHNEAFAFKDSGITSRVSKHGATFAEHRLTPPPPEVYSLHRKLAGAIFICIRMGATIPCRDMLEEVYRNYQWDAGTVELK
jgi:aarF domain-containing kinase